MAHVHISEREAGAWIDCVATSGLEVARLMGMTQLPATLAEAKAIKVAGGGSYGSSSSYSIFANGMLARHKITLPALLRGRDVIWAALTPGKASAVSGLMGNFPAGHPLRRWQPGFTAGHATSVQRLDATDRVWWCDPLAPQDSVYRGEWISKADLMTFIGAGTTWNAFVVPIKEDLVTVVTLSKYPAPRRFSVSAGAFTGFKLGSAAKTLTIASGGSSAQADAAADVQPRPAGWPVGALLRVLDGGLAGYFIDAARVVLAAGPAETVLKSKYDTDVATLNDRIRRIKAKVAATNVDVSDD